MALSTLLEIVQRAAGEIGLPRPASVVGNTDIQTRQLYDFANAVGADLLEHHPWTALQTLETVTTVADQADYDLPEDFQAFISGTEWDRTNQWRLIGPDDPQADRAIRESGTVEPVFRRFRRFGDHITINPTPSASGETLVYEYASKYWARSSTGTAQEEFEADTDTAIFPGRLIVDGIKLKFMAAKGMYADPLRDEYEARLARLVASDLGGEILRMDVCHNHHLSDPSFVVASDGSGTSASSSSSELILD